MDVIKSLILGTILSITIGLVIGTQGTSGGALAIHLVEVADMRLYWSWPVFVSGSILSFCLLLLQR